MQPAANGSRRLSKGVERARKVEIDRKVSTAPMLAIEPSRLNEEDFRALLMSCVMSGSSDITLQTDNFVRADIAGQLFKVTRRPLAPSEIDMILTETYGAPNGRTEINGREILDYSYELNLDAGARQRFRVNATGIQGTSGSSVEITLRALAQTTPTLKLVRLNQVEVDALSPRDGMVVIAGGTGSGKSTTMAAVTRTHLENVERPVKIVDLQAPIEYTFRDVVLAQKNSASVIGQSEVGRHIKSFAAGVHSALRRKPNIINVGEARDPETLRASILAAITGHLVYTTTHAGTVAETFQRMVAEFPADERATRAYDLASSLRFVMVQRLLPRADRIGVIPVREYLRITDRVRARLLSMDPNSWPGMISDEVAGRAPGRGPEDMRQSLAEVGQPLFEHGVISAYNAAQLGVDISQREVA